MKQPRPAKVFVMMMIGVGHLLAADAIPFKPGFFQSEYWKDGKAEVTVFEASEKREGVVRPAEVKHIAVREPFSPKSLVKAEDWQAPGVYDVLKLNQIVHVPTGTYAFFQMHSSFWRIDNGQLVKFSMASSDSCGNSYKEGRISGSQLSYHANTYWEGMDRVQKQIEAQDNLLFYDELPLKLRSLDWEKAKQFSANVIPCIIGSKADQLIASPAQFTVQETPEGKVVIMRTGSGEDRFLFDKESPHLLREWRRADGSQLRLKSSVRIAYWKLSNPGDEKFLYQP